MKKILIFLGSLIIMSVSFVYMTSIAMEPPPEEWQTIQPEMEEEEWELTSIEPLAEKQVTIINNTWIPLELVTQFKDGKVRRYTLGISTILARGKLQQYTGFPYRMFPIDNLERMYITPLAALVGTRELIEIPLGDARRYQYPEIFINLTHILYRRPYFGEIAALIEEEAPFYFDVRESEGLKSITQRIGEYLTGLIPRWPATAERPEVAPAPPTPVAPEIPTARVLPGWEEAQIQILDPWSAYEKLTGQIEELVKLNIDIKKEIQQLEQQRESLQKSIFLTTAKKLQIVGIEIQLSLKRDKLAIIKRNLRRWLKMIPEFSRSAFDYLSSPEGKRLSSEEQQALRNKITTLEAMRLEVEKTLE